MPRARSSTADPVSAELAAIKRLLVFALLRDGATQKEVASALGVDQSQVSRMFEGGLGRLARDVKKG